MAFDQFTFNYYDQRRTWASTMPGWYESRVRIFPDNTALARLSTVMEWLFDNIDKPDRHCRWTVDEIGDLKVKFRHEKDYVWFNLTWG
jgi:hypothetical protein